jgi:hypothetical protein
VRSGSSGHSFVRAEIAGPGPSSWIAVPNRISSSIQVEVSQITPASWPTAFGDFNLALRLRMVGVVWERIRQGSGRPLPLRSHGYFNGPDVF